MKKIQKIFLLLQLTSVLYAQFNVLETQQQRLIYYGTAHSYLVNHTGRCVENAMNFHTALFDYDPTEKVTILMHDFSDYGNAKAFAIPKNNIVVNISPFNYAYETVIPNERMNWIMNHEVLHIVTSDDATTGDKIFRSLFAGKVLPTSDNPMSMIYGYLTNPRMYAPVWYFEGTAVFFETWMAGGLGRAMGAYDEMVFRTMVRDSSPIYDMVGLESEATQADFQVGVNYYLYGTRFISYLAFHYGPDKIIKWISRSERSKAYFASQFANIYGISLEEAWNQWVQWENQFQVDNLSLIHQYPLTAYEPITEKGLGSISRPYYNPLNRKLYAAIMYPGQIAHLAAIDVESGDIEKICDIKGPSLYTVTSLAFDQSTATLFYTTDNYEWRDLVAVDIKTGESKILMEDIRTGDLTFNISDRSLWGVRHFNGRSTIVRIPYPYLEWNQIYSLPYGQDIYNIDISPDGRYLSGAFAEISGKQHLIKMNLKDLMNGDQSMEKLFNFDKSIPANFSFSPDGKYIYGSSYFSGVSNIYRWDVDANDMSIITNGETGYFHPRVYSEDSLIVLNYTTNGFQPVIIPETPLENVKAIHLLGQRVIKKYPQLEEWMIGSPAKINLDSLTIYSGEYEGLKSLNISSIYPVVEGYKDFPAYGLRFNLSDPIGLHRIDLTGSYSPNNLLEDNEKMHVAANYSYMNWKLSYTYNHADFYDLFGPTKVGRKGYSFGINYDKTLLYDQPRTMNYSISLTHYGGLERLPDFQNIGATYEKLLTARLSFNYKYLTASLGAVTNEKGFEWYVESTANYVNNKIFPRIYNNFDYGFALPINHSSIWIRSSLGYSYGDRGDPFANFYFGGFGNNWIDYLTSKRYKEYYSFPGVELNEIGGINYAKLLLEWTLPPVRFKHFGLPIFYSPWVRPALFTSGIITNIDSNDYRSSIYNIGTQVDFRFILLSRFNTTFSLGYALAFEKNQNLSKEFMISLKIL
jgi:WD40 repeat protein